MAAQAGDYPAFISRDPFQQPADMRDPLAERGQQEENSEGIIEAGVGLQLRAIILAGNASMADVNGEIIGPGEEVEGYRLISINADRVFLEKEGVRVEVLLAE